MVGKKHPFTGYPAVKHPKHSKFAITDVGENRWIFLLFNTGVDFSLRNNFANSGSFAKVSVPVHIYNSLLASKLSNIWASIAYKKKIAEFLFLYTLQFLEVTKEL